MSRRPLGLTAAGVTVGLALAVAPALSAAAHPSETSAVLVTVNAASVDLELQVPLDRYALATDSDVTATDAAVASHESEIVAYVLAHLTLADTNGTLATAVDAVSLATVNDLPTLVVDVAATPADGSLDGSVTLDYDVVSERIATHAVYVSLVSDYQAGALTDEDPQLLAVLGTSNTTVVLQRADTSWWQGFAATVRLGMAHIASGTDHILFLAMLLLAGVSAIRARGASVGARVRSALGRTALIATAFTLGHSLTLALVTFGWVSIPAVVVESLVAVSIVVAAAHAARPVLPRAELVIAAGFGLVHGAAFARTLVELDLEPGALVGALIGFNVGVELAQLIAIVALMPLLALAAASRWFPPVRVGLAVVGAVAGVAWLVGILTGTDSVLQPAIDAVAANPLVAYIAFAAAMVLLWAVGKPPAPDRPAAPSPRAG